MTKSAIFFSVLATAALFSAVSCGGARRVDNVKIDSTSIEKRSLNVRLRTSEIKTSATLRRSFIYEPIDPSKPSKVDGLEIQNGKLTIIEEDENIKVETKKDSAAGSKGVKKQKLAKNTKKIDAEEINKNFIIWIFAIAFFFIFLYFLIKRPVKVNV